MTSRLHVIPIKAIHTYGTTSTDKRFTTVVCVLLFLAMIASYLFDQYQTAQVTKSWMSILDMREANARRFPTQMDGVLLGLFLSLLVFRVAFSSVLTLSPGGIRLRLFGVTRSLRFEDIAGRRIEIDKNHRKVTVIEARNNPSRSIRIPVFLRLDTHYHRWLKSLPDLDAPAGNANDVRCPAPEAEAKQQLQGVGDEA